jgi:quercetin dioxygenase-like cupin family protein
MKIFTPIVPPQEKRPATKILHADEGIRVVAFTVAPGQSIPSHVNAGTVSLVVLEGSGVFHGRDGEQVRLGPGQMVIYEPDEPHAITGNGEMLRFVAFITTGPQTTP